MPRENNSVARSRIGGSLKVMNNATVFARYPSLRDRVVLITGGASGIGAAMVEQFAMQGARVAFLDIDQTSAAGLIESLKNRSVHQPLFLHCDLTDIAQLRKSVSEVQSRVGSARVLVNNAANDERHRVEDVTPEYFDERLAVNLRHYFFAMQAVAPAMKAAGGGSIINISSIAWVIPSTGMPIYIAAKAAIVGLTRTMAHELGGDQIRVNSVSPGAIMTDRQRRLWFTPEYLSEIKSRQALPREISPEDVARLVLFLASDDSAAITNQNYVIDGGWV
jgi:NAD(P)-dependent dehydrogenase (short-subunit alcohol dehydrogenase family)